MSLVIRLQPDYSSSCFNHVIRWVRVIGIRPRFAGQVRPCKRSDQYRPSPHHKRTDSDAVLGIQFWLELGVQQVRTLRCECSLGASAILSSIHPKPSAESSRTPAEQRASPCSAGRLAGSPEPADSSDLPTGAAAAGAHEQQFLRQQLHNASSRADQFPQGSESSRGKTLFITAHSR